MVTSNKKADDHVTIFDRNLIGKNRVRAAKKFEGHSFLFDWSQQQLHDRLMDVNRIFDHAVHIGSRIPIDITHPKINALSVLDMTPFPVTPITAPYIQADEEFLPFAPKCLDLIISNLNLHSVNDLPGTLIQIKYALKNDGLFMATMLGGETLHELRDIMATIEIAHYGGISPHIYPFADKPQMGDLLQRAGFSLPVVDSEIITVTYDNAFKLFQDLRNMGERNTITARRKTPLTKSFFMDVARDYQDKFAEDDGRIIASFEVIFLLGWSPDSSQQKPLRPGSAKHSLADALGTTEFSTGDKARP